jgi:DNA-directed RNA polymerase subunit K/omega
MTMAKTNKDGMRYPSIDELVKKHDVFTKEDGSTVETTHTKYQLAYLAAKRAKLIEEDNYRKKKLLNNHPDDDDEIDEELALEDDRDNYLCVKPVGMALEEYLNGDVHCEFKSNDLTAKQNEKALEENIKADEE